MVWCCVGGYRAGVRERTNGAHPCCGRFGRATARCCRVQVLGCCSKTRSRIFHTQNLPWILVWADDVVAMSGQACCSDRVPCSCVDGIAWIESQFDHLNSRVCAVLWRGVGGGWRAGVKEQTNGARLCSGRFGRARARCCRVQMLSRKLPRARRQNFPYQNLP